MYFLLCRYHREHSLQALSSAVAAGEGEGQAGEDDSLLRLLCPSDVVYISSKTGVGMDTLVDALSSALERLDF